MRHKLPVRLVAALALMLCSAGWTLAAEWHGNYFPNVELTDQDGNRYRFYDDLLKGKIVTINFIYTNCKDICPADTAQLSQVQAQLGDRVGRDFHMYSITIDPDHDTPEVLKTYMHTFGLKPGWLFLTGAKEDIKLIQQKLAMRVFEPGKPRDHDTSVMVANETTGQWIKRSVYDDPVVLANLLTDRMTNYATSIAGTKQDYSVARQLPPQSRGEYLFRTRCVSCHTMGSGDRLGPDLLGVASSRPHDWMSRWIREPDKMIEEGDPVATALRAKYKDMPMPNFGLGEKEATALIDYMASEDTKAAAKAAKAKPRVKN
ncbi:MAG: SCO family protein [Micropepsaceae bacterium]